MPVATTELNPFELDKAIRLLDRHKMMLADGSSAVYNKLRNAKEYLEVQLAEILSDGGAQ